MNYGNKYQQATGNRRQAVGKKKFSALNKTQKND
jgi:hypothetical protein